MKLRITVWVLLVIILISSVLIASRAFAEGNITLEPQHDFLQGNGGIATFDADMHIANKWYLQPNAQLSTIQRYRDANGSLDLAYKWNDTISTSFGGGYDSYHHFGDDRIESEDAHIKVKYKLWN